MLRAVFVHPVAPILVAYLLAVGLCAGPAPLNSQTGGRLIGIGPTYTLTRPGDRPLWGIAGRWQSSPKLGLVYRAHGSLQFARKGPEPNPLLATAGVDLGVRGGGGLDAISFTLGPSAFYYLAGSDEQRNNSYDPGFLLMVTAKLGFELQVGARTSAFMDYALHVPSRLGNNGYAGDPTAAVLGLSLGLAFLR